MGTLLGILGNVVAVFVCFLGLLGGLGVGCCLTTAWLNLDYASTL